jgi:hypothetical protein
METSDQSTKPASLVNGALDEFADEIDITGMNVVKREEIGIVRQVIQLTSQDRLIPVIVAMLKWMVTGKYTGHLKLHMVKGGLKRIETEQDTK